jgi:hypothetical protein
LGERKFKKRNKIKMPRILYLCSCGITTPYYLTIEKITPFKTCSSCQKEAKRVLSGPASLNKITVDNGVSAKAVEIIPNILELNEERRKNEKKRQ